MMHRIRSFRSFSALGLAAGATLSLLASGCIEDEKPEPAKGEVDTSSPPDVPGAGLDVGKADNPANLVAFAFESLPHPYTNNFNKTYTVTLNTLPSCATEAKIHFASLRTEARYDFVTIIDGRGATVATLDGNRDGYWTPNFVALDANKSFKIRLTSDYSITDYGFRIDQVEWAGRPMCPVPPEILCTADQIDLRAPAPVCGCPGLPHCTPLSTVVVTHSTGGGFTGAFTGKRTHGTDAFTTSSTPAAGETQTHFGTVDQEALKRLLGDMAAAGVLEGGRAESSNWTECFTIVTDTKTASYCAPAGTHTTLISAFIARFESLVDCSSGTLTCDAGQSCQSGACTAGCFCPLNYDPACGTNGHTYSNNCAAGCAGVGVAHPGECGITGDSCGTIFGLVCQDEFKCRYGASTYSAPFPDAGGSCVGDFYCDAAADCNDPNNPLIHPAVPGSWACGGDHICRWVAGPAWTTLSGSRFESAHPYADNENQWKQLYLPTGGTRMRLLSSGTFNLESGYDFLEVWRYDTTTRAWSKIKSYTGTTAPSTADVFTGQYFYLHFVSDYSETRHGFAVTAEYGTN